MITIAFLGTPAPHKGWQVFENLYHSHKNTGRLRFLFLGAADVPVARMAHEHVHVTGKNLDAMVEAVARHEVDLVLQWPSWPETFSLSTFEAYVGGAYVITNEISGNVADTVRALDRGAVLRDEEDLARFVTDGRLDKTVCALRAERAKSKVTRRFSRLVHHAIDLRAAKEDAA